MSFVYFSNMPRRARARFSNLAHPTKLPHDTNRSIGLLRGAACHRVSSVLWAKPILRNTRKAQHNWHNSAKAIRL